MERLFRVASGIDVHRDTLVVTVRRSDGGREKTQTKTFETFHDDVVRMVAWMVECGVQVVALESTGVFWKPVVRALQLGWLGALWLVNPLHVKRVPGRKTDVTDSQWLSKLAMYGLVSPSYLASPEQEQLRLLTRHRVRLVGDKTRWVNRTIKELQAAGIKLDTVCSRPLGKSGREMLEAILEGKLAPDQIAELARGRLRSKLSNIKRAVQGSFSESSKLVLRQCLRQIDAMDALIADIDAEIVVHLNKDLEVVARLCEIPGIEQTAAAAIVAEMGADMSMFDSAKHLASWAGLSPGSNESAGKRKNSPARKGDKYLRRIIVQCAVTASKTKNTFWKTKFGRLLRLGKKKAYVAIGRKLLTCIYHMLSTGQRYVEPVLPPPSTRQRERDIKLHTDRLRALGFDVSLTPKPAADPQKPQENPNVMGSVS
jgi:transposase